MIKFPELPAVTEYLIELEGAGDCSDLHYAECNALSEALSDPDGLDWADQSGAETLHAYWLAAETKDRQMQLGRICHMRALAWDAIWTAHSDARLPGIFLIMNSKSS